MRRPTVPLLDWLLFPGLVLLAFAYTSPSAQPVPLPKSATAPKSLVKVITRRKGNATQFLVENQELCEITMTFAVGLVNLKSSVHLPYTASFPPGKLTEAFTLSPEDPGSKWSFDYTNYFKLGSKAARHDDHFVYELPYTAGEKLEVTQGYNGCFSHTGPNKYAIDWQMPQGTLVRAARGGVVVRTKDDSDRGGGSMEFDRYNNYVLIRHDDGTLGQYCHLQKAGVMVQPGQRVATGDPIAHSGSTGFSTGPHLHFSVYTAQSGRDRVSIPVKFHTSDGPALTLLSGHSYAAGSVSLAGAQEPPPTPATLAEGAGGASVQ